MKKNKITHLNLPETERQLADMRRAQRRVSLSHYIAELIRQDAEEAGLVNFLSDGEGAQS